MSNFVVNKPAPGLSYFTPAQDPVSGAAIDPQPDGRAIPTLFRKLRIRGVEFQNRIWVRALACSGRVQEINGASTTF
jgi:hypothetical protein